MTYVTTRVLVDEKKIAAKVEKARKALAPDVVRIRFHVTEDWAGDPAIYFRVLLSDRAAKVPKLYETGQRAEREILRRFDPDEMGLIPYFKFRSVSEQAELKEERWE